jgi:hypothetical protein
MSEYCGPQTALDFPYPQNPLFAWIAGNDLDRAYVIPQFSRFFEIDPMLELIAMAFAGIEFELHIECIRIF